MFADPAADELQESRPWPLSKAKLDAAENCHDQKSPTLVRRCTTAGFESSMSVRENAEDVQTRAERRLTPASLLTNPTQV